MMMVVGDGWSRLGEELGDDGDGGVHKRTQLEWERGLRIKREDSGESSRKITLYVGSENALSQIVQLVEAPQLTRALVQKLADQVVIVAFLTWLGWFIPGEFGLFPEN
ncbi:hypothetical protein DVH24_039030 [Malus domestica]|uniref:Uncharacterized protein n=1 Tax=Malus domestica TaxID=3750 RepID=A0A498KBM2_MALDO|nr:hypothetical protein DVH24_039030 [Malus domestica]